MPTAVKDYNRHRSGVDTMDQLVSYSSVSRKSRRWWPRLCWWFVDVAIHNAHKLFQRVVEPSCTAHEFRTALMHQLAEGATSSVSDAQPKRRRVSRQNTDTHRLGLSDKESDCSICSHQPSHRKRTSFSCVACTVPVCASPCYDAHRLADE